jgi:hypothetical protein
VASSQPCFEQQIASITGFVGTYTAPISIGLVSGLHRMALAGRGYLKPSSFLAGIGPFGYPLGTPSRPSTTLWRLQFPRILLRSSSFSKQRNRNACSPLPSESRVMSIQRRHWLDYDPVALAVLAIGMGIIELLALLL